MEQAGFEGSELVAETGFNSSSITKGVLIRAFRPGMVSHESAADRSLALPEACLRGAGFT